MSRFLVSTIGMLRSQATRQCVEQAIRHARDADFILTSNGCAETAAEFDDLAARHSNVTHVRNSENEGFQKPNNAAYHEAAKRGCTYFVALNDDCMVPDGFLQTLAAPLDADPSAAICGPQGGCEHLNDDFHGGPGAPDYVEGSLMMVKISAMSRLRPTLFWDKLQFIYSEDSEASLFLREKGYAMAKVHMRVDHFRSQTVNRTPEVQAKCRAAQEHNHQLCRERFAYWIPRRRFDFPVIIRRAHSLGDVILTTPVIRAIKAMLPRCPIHVETDFPEVFDRNPYVASALKQQPRQPAELRIGLDMAYENQPNTHIVHGYEAEVRRWLAIDPVELKTDLFPARDDVSWAASIAREIGQPFAVLHMDHSHWTGRNLPHERFIELAETLHGQGVACVTVGRHPTPNIRAMNLIGKTSLHQLAALCSKAKLFVGMCSGPLHVAQAVGCPTIGAFGVTRSRFILTHRGPSLGLDGEGADAGLRHSTPGQSFVPGTGEAVRSITEQQIQRAVSLLCV